MTPQRPFWLPLLPQAPTWDPRLGSVVSPQVVEELEERVERVESRVVVVTGGGADVPLASPLLAGKVKVGSSLRVASDGTLDVDPSVVGTGLAWTDAVLTDGLNTTALPDGQVPTRLLFLPAGSKSPIDLLPFAQPPHPAGQFRFQFGAPDGPVEGKLGKEVALISAGNAPAPIAPGSQLAVASVVPSGAGGLARSVTLTGREPGARTFTVRIKQASTILKTFSKTLDAGVGTFDFALSEVSITQNGTYAVEVEDQQYADYRPSKTFQVTEIAPPVVCTLGIDSLTQGQGGQADKYTVVLRNPQAGSTLYRAIHRLGGVEKANYTLPPLTGSPQSFVFDKDDVGTAEPGSYQLTVRDEITGCEASATYVVPQPAPPPAPSCTLLVASVQNGIDNNPRRRGIFLQGEKPGVRSYQFKLYKAGVLFYTSPTVTFDVGTGPGEYPSINFNDDLVGITQNGTDYQVEVRDLGAELSQCPPSVKGFSVAEYTVQNLSISAIQRQGAHLFRVALAGYQTGVRNYVLRIEPQGWNGVSAVPQPGRTVAVDLSSQSVGGALLFNEVTDGVRANGTYVVKVWEGALPPPVPTSAAQGTYTTSDFQAQAINLVLESQLNNAFSWSYSGEAYEAPTNYDLQYTTGPADFSGVVITEDFDLFTSGGATQMTQGTSYKVRIRAATPTGTLYSNTVTFTAGSGGSQGGGGEASTTFSVAEGRQNAQETIAITAANIAGKIRLTDAAAPTDDLSGGYTRRYLDRTYFTDRGSSLAFLQDLPPYYDGILIKSIDQGMNWWDYSGAAPNLIREISFATFNTGAGQ